MQVNVNRKCGQERKREREDKAMINLLRYFVFFPYLNLNHLTIPLKEGQVVQNEIANFV